MNYDAVQVFPDLFLPHFKMNMHYHKIFSFGILVYYGISQISCQNKPAFIAYMMRTRYRKNRYRKQKRTHTSENMSYTHLFITLLIILQHDWLKEHLINFVFKEKCINHIGKLVLAWSFFNGDWSNFLGYSMVVKLTRIFFDPSSSVTKRLCVHHVMQFCYKVHQSYGPNIFIYVIINFNYSQACMYHIQQKV